LNYLRYILVITQIVVIGVFFYKFKTDQDIVDLNEAIDQKKEIVSVSQPLIKEASQIEFKLTEIQKIINKQDKFSAYFNYIISVFPEDLFLKSLVFSNDKEFVLEGYSLQPEIINKFYTRLKKSNKFKNVILKYLKKADYQYDFAIEMT